MDVAATTTLEAMPVVDVDSHFTEPRDFWTSRAPQALRDRAPRVIRDADGSERWLVDRDIFLGPPGFCVIRNDDSKAYGMMSLPTFDAI